MSKRENPFAALNTIFHEPNRLAIVSALCNAEDGMTFLELKEECALTDGNLSRHLKSLQDARVIRIKKAFFKSKPQTTVFLTERGREHFVEYLEALEEVLQKASESVSTVLPLSVQKPARA
jgi:DNA-binding transcriptional ArsR family regulator